MPTVEKVELKKEYEGKFGPMKVYRVKIDGTTGEMQQKASTPPPQEGQSVEGTWEEGKFGPVFKKAKPMNGGGFRARDPKETAAIQRQHSQEMGIRWAVQTGIKDLGQLRELIDWFDLDIKDERVTGEKFVELVKREFNAIEEREDHGGALDVISDSDVKLLEDEVRRYVESSDNQDQARSVARMKMVEFGVENPDGKLATVLRQLTPDGAKRLLDWLKQQEF